MNFELQKPELSVLRPGNTNVEGLWHFDSGQPRRCVLIMALIQGNWPCGVWALKAAFEANMSHKLSKLTLIFGNLQAFDSFGVANYDACAW